MAERKLSSSRPSLSDVVMVAMVVWPWFRSGFEKKVVCEKSLRSSTSFIYRECCATYLSLLAVKCGGSVAWLTRGRSSVGTQCTHWLKIFFTFCELINEMYFKTL